MKYKILKLSILLVMISTISSSKENIDVSKPIESICGSNTCLQKGNEYAINASCVQKEAIKDIINEAAEDAAAENEVPISPISRFILLQ